MELVGEILPGYRVYEYVVILSPPEALCESIGQVQEKFAQEYQAEQKPRKPSLLLAHFLQYEMQERRLVQRLRHVAADTKPLKIELQDYGSKPTHTIYIQVSTMQTVQGLVKKLRTEAQSLMKINAANKPHFLLEPYIAIAQQLKPWQYEKGWNEYQHQSFSGRFVAHEIELWRKELGKAPYQQVENFAFLQQKQEMVQGQLFP